MSITQQTFCYAPDTATALGRGKALMLAQFDG
jgi:hypothetical protein